jgi:enoyl-CoA hydratase/carnithine racemase
MAPSYPAYQDIKLSFQADRKLAIVTLNRPARRNAWTLRMSQDIADCYERLDTDEDVRAVIMTGTGPAFCLGAELAEGKNPFAGDASNDAVSHRDTGGVAAMAVWKCKKVTIAGKLTLTHV